MGAASRVGGEVTDDKMDTADMTLPPLPLPGLCMDVGTGFRKWYSADQMNAHATAAVLAEREACALVCDEEASIEGIAQRCANFIRERSAV